MKRPASLVQSSQTRNRPGEYYQWRSAQWSKKILTSGILSLLMITSGCATLAKDPDNRITAEHVKEFTRYYIDVMTAPYDGILQLRYSSFNLARRFKLIKTYDPVWTFERWDKKVYFAHSEFESLDGAISLELDFWLVSFGEKMRLTDIKIYKVNGEPWFTYDKYNVGRLR